MTGIRESNEQFQRSMHQFMRTVRTLTPEQFAEAMNGWSARDVVAHLIGWNRACIDIADAVHREEAPAALIDPGEDFSEVNARFVRQYDATDMTELLRELELSYQELARHLYTVDEQDWARETAIPGWDDTITLESVVRDLSGDYAAHMQEIASWRQSRGTD